MSDQDLDVMKWLVDYGLSLALARQMVETMNYAQASARIPGVMNPLSPAPQSYHVVVDGRVTGPLSGAELSRLIGEGRVDEATLVWRPGLARWQSAGETADVQRLFSMLRPPPVPSGAVR